MISVQPTVNIKNIVAEKSERTYPRKMRGIGENIRRLRESKRWSQKKLADESGVNTETVNRAEHDMNLTIGMLEKIASGLGVRFFDLLPDDQKSTSAAFSDRYFCRNPLHNKIHEMLDDLLEHPETDAAKGIIANIGLMHQSPSRELPSELKKIAAVMGKPGIHVVRDPEE